MDANRVKSIQKNPEPSLRSLGLSRCMAVWELPLRRLPEGLTKFRKAFNKYFADVRSQHGRLELQREK